MPPLDTPNGRRAWSFAAIMGACFVFTTFAAVAVWRVSGDLAYSFYLGLAAHLQLFIALGAFSFTLGRRMQIEATRDGVKLNDAAQGAQQATDAAQAATDELKETAQ
jgi:hypothetical protein